MSAQEEILVIKHGALGDIVLATGPMAAIRAHHPHARITLLTAKPYDALLGKAPYFNDVWVDSKPKVWQFAGVQKLRRLLNSRPFSRVYDLQTSQRSTSYFQLFKYKPQWSGLVPGEFYHDTPHRTQSHTLDREREQLNLAGIHEVPGPDLRWLTADISHFALPERYVVLVPGGSAHRPEKRWPQEGYTALARVLLEVGITPVLIGTGAEAAVLNAIEAAEVLLPTSPRKQGEEFTSEGATAGKKSPPLRAGEGDSAKACVDKPKVINLCNQTSFAELAALGRGALAAVGNDTGPMHLIAATQCPSVVLFSAASNPAMCAPRGDKVQVLQRDPLAQLSVDEVFSVVKPWLRLDSAS
jgi:ADP-heptose:LPS heptosyltransferase